MATTSDDSYLPDAEPFFALEVRDDNLGRLFLQAQRVLTRRGIAKLRARGHDRLTPAHTALLHHLDTQGLSVTILAERSGMTKQSMRQLVLDLENKGYVVRVPDPCDRRATIVTFTAEGRRLLKDAGQIRTEMEAEYAAVLGRQGLADLKAALHLLAESQV